MLKWVICMNMNWILRLIISKATLSAKICICWIKDWKDAIWTTRLDRFWLLLVFWLQFAVGFGYRFWKTKERSPWFNCEQKGWSMKNKITTIIINWIFLQKYKKGEPCDVMRWHLSISFNCLLLVKPRALKQNYQIEKEKKRPSNMPALPFSFFMVLFCVLAARHALSMSLCLRFRENIIMVQMAQNVVCAR